MSGVAQNWLVMTAGIQREAKKAGFVETACFLAGDSQYYDPASYEKAKRPVLLLSHRQDGVTLVVETKKDTGFIQNARLVCLWHHADFDETPPFVFPSVIRPVLGEKESDFYFINSEVYLTFRSFLGEIDRCSRGMVLSPLEPGVIAYPFLAPTGELFKKALLTMPMDSTRFLGSLLGYGSESAAAGVMDLASARFAALRLEPSARDFVAHAAPAFRRSRRFALGNGTV